MIPLPLSNLVLLYRGLKAQRSVSTRRVDFIAFKSISSRLSLIFVGGLALILGACEDEAPPSFPEPQVRPCELLPHLHGITKIDQIWP